MNATSGRGRSGAGWERLFTNPATGEIVRTDHYRPTADQRRRLIARDVTCRFPGCSTPAARCDIDHNQEYSRGGPTSIDNMSYLCERHHVMRHREGWKIKQLPRGVLEFTSPTGKTYTDKPISHVFFTEGDESRGASPGVRGSGRTGGKPRPRQWTLRELSSMTFDPTDPPPWDAP